MGTITNLSEYRAAKRGDDFVVNMLRVIYRTGWDGQLTVGFVIQHCRNPALPIPQHDLAVLKTYGLLDERGAVGEDVVKVVLARLKRSAQESFGS